MTAASPQLSLSGLSKRYGATMALDGLDLEVAEGRFFVLFGPSSVGKTTTLRTIAGLVRPGRGRVEIVGARRDPRADRRPRRVDGVPVLRALSASDRLREPRLSAARGRRAARRDRQARQRDRRDAALAHRLERKPGTLSGGEQQRVALGRSLIRRPQILLLDEPLTNLDAKLRHDMRAELKRLHRQFGMTIIYATPDELEALSMGEEIAVMRDGPRRAARHARTSSTTARATSMSPRKIGSPPMNIIDGRADADGRGGRDCPSASRSGRGDAGLTPSGGRVIVGIRPADIRLARQRRGAALARVSLVEPLGDVTIVVIAPTGQRCACVLPEAQARWH